MAKRSAKHRDKMRDRGHVFKAYRAPQHLAAEFDSLVRFAIAQHEGELLLETEIARVGALCGMPGTTTH